MLFADATRRLKCKLAGAKATNDVPITGGWSEIVAATAGWTDCQIIFTVSNGTAEITLIDLAASGRIRKLQGLHVQNADTAAVVFILYDDDDTNERVCLRVTLAVGDNLYVADDGSWRVIDSSGNLKSNGTAAGNALLDGSVHTDTVAAAVARGALVYGNSTPKWDKLTVGAANKFLQADGTDISWVAMSNDATLSAGAITVSQSSTGFTWAGVQTLSLTANVTDQTINAATNLLLVTPNASGWTLDGFTGGTNGRQLKIVNIDTTATFNLLAGAASSAAAANQVRTSGVTSFAVPPVSAVTLLYETLTGSLGRWVLADYSSLDASMLRYKNGSLWSSNRLMVTSSGVPSEMAAGLDFQVAGGVTGGAPAWKTLTAGTGVAIANAAGSLTVSVAGESGNALLRAERFF